MNNVREVKSWRLWRGVRLEGCRQNVPLSRVLGVQIFQNALSWLSQSCP